MKRISAYQATDGTIFNDKQACKVHQAQLDIVDGIKTIVNRIKDDPHYYVNESEQVHLDLDQLARFILANGPDIKSVFSGKPLKED